MVVRNGACTEWQWAAADDSSAGFGPDASPGAGRPGTSGHYTNECASRPGKNIIFTTIIFHFILVTQATFSLHTVDENTCWADYWIA